MFHFSTSFAFIFHITSSFTFLCFCVSSLIHLTFLCFCVSPLLLLCFTMFLYFKSRPPLLFLGTKHLCFTSSPSCCPIRSKYLCLYPTALYSKPNTFLFLIKEVYVLRGMVWIDLIFSSDKSSFRNHAPLLIHKNKRTIILLFISLLLSADSVREESIRGTSGVGDPQNSHA